MIEAGGVTSLIYQEQVGRENQIQKGQASRQEPEEKSSRQGSGSADVTSFSAEGLELAKAAVTATQAAPEAELDQKPQQDEQVVPVSQTSGSSSAHYLNIQA